MVTGGLENGDDKSPPSEFPSCSIFILVLSNIASTWIVEITAITLIRDDESATESDNSDMVRPQTPINVSNSAAPSTPLMNIIVTQHDRVLN